MAERTCLWCGVSIDHKRSNAKYCCIQHKKNDGAKRFRSRNPGYYKRYHGNPTRIAWREANLERIRTYAREYQAHYPQRAERGRQWREANRDYFVVRERNRKAMKLNNPGSIGVSLRDWQRLCRRYHGGCAYCGSSTRIEMDHVIPLTKGGRHAIGNVLPACRTCNTSKNARLLVSWRHHCNKPVQWIKGAA